MQQVVFHTLGCKLNYAETAAIARQFITRGFRVVDADQVADVVVLNTCSVTERADRECRQLVRRALRASPKAYVIVIGCYAQLQPEDISAIEGVDLVLGTSEKFRIFDHADWQKSGLPRVRVAPVAEAQEFHHASSIGFAERTRAFLKIQDGCDYTCSFCTIPKARGTSRSVSVDELLAEARRVVGQGYREIVLTGVNVGDFGRKTGSSLLNLLRSLATVDGLDRIRVSSVEPNLLTDELLDFWIDSERMCKHFHIPLQSGSDKILQAMRRRYRRSWYEGRISRIKLALPDAGIGADVIVGFPGESNDEFEETYSFLLDLPITYLHVFSYSERVNTAAVHYGHPVEPHVRSLRSERLRMLSGRKRRLFHESLIGSTRAVLFEQADNGQTGLTGEYVKVTVESSEVLSNKIVPTRLAEATDEGCLGKVILPESDSMAVES
jgi:threonylcarbamoyladenosine tRNA methylthiotransferase MtaB